MTKWELVGLVISLVLTVIVLISGVLTLSIPALAMGTFLLLFALAYWGVVMRLSDIRESVEVTAFMQQRRLREDTSGAGAHD